ncbi:MAG: hypothetical protein KA257_12645 [Opitutaceae bacterium]|nr:hypothetical protein [Opitutaceae bacterium]MBP9914495.1 hypothetical protein [Opitutaceae bacterium]
MKIFRPAALLLFTCLLTATVIAAETAAEKEAREEKVKARLAEHARANATKSVADTPAPAKEGTPTAATDTPPSPPVAGAITTLPGIEVRGTRITEIDIKIRKLEKEIAREKKKTKSSDLDKSLNDPALTKSFSLFGGKSTEQRESVAAERVSLMEGERDLLEAMKTARTKAEVDLLQKKVDDLKAMRRDLDQALR